VGSRGPSKWWSRGSRPIDWAAGSARRWGPRVDIFVTKPRPLSSRSAR
jgi:hypothetical protein